MSTDRNSGNKFLCRMNEQQYLKVKTFSKSPKSLRGCTVHSLLHTQWFDTTFHKLLTFIREQVGIPSQRSPVGKGAKSRYMHFEKCSLNLSSSFFVIHVDQSSPSLTMLVLLWFFIISLVLFHLSKLLLSGFLQLKVILYVAKTTQITMTELL